MRDPLVILLSKSLGFYCTALLLLAQHAIACLPIIKLKNVGIIYVEQCKVRVFYTIQGVSYSHS